MKLPQSLEPLRETFLWQRLRDWRYLRNHRTRSEFYRQFVKPGSLVFDIGANVGHYTLLFHALGARVVVVEPQSGLVAGLRRRFRGRRNINFVPTALGRTASTATLHKTADLSEVASLRSDIGERSRFAADHPFSATETVPVTTLDSLLAQFGTPDFSKIDVEGYEDEVLSGLSRPLPALSFEFNREFEEVSARCVSRLMALADYRFNYVLGEATALASPTWVTADALFAELKANPDPFLWGDIYARVPSQVL
jgi:FkbM family methyltransferase